MAKFNLGRVRGADGAPGRDGEQGLPGIQGPQGPKGDPGSQIPISDAVDSADSGVAASSLAVKTAYDKAMEAVSTIQTEYILKQRLTSDLTLYVRTDGNDSNNGLENSPEGAFATLKAACEYASVNYHMGNYQLMIMLWNGTFQVPGELPAVESFGNPVEIIGGWDSTLENSLGFVNPVLVRRGSHYRFTQLTFNIIGYGETFPQHTLSAEDSGILSLRSVTLNVDALNATPYDTLMYATNGGSIYTDGDNVISIVNGNQFPYVFQSNGLGVINISGNWNVSGTFGTFAVAMLQGYITVAHYAPPTFLWSGVGRKYLLERQGIINTNTRDTSFFPGNIPGRNDPVFPGFYF